MAKVSDEEKQRLRDQGYRDGKLGRGENAPRPTGNVEGFVFQDWSQDVKREEYLDGYRGGKKDRNR